MIIFDSITKSDAYIELAKGDDEKMILPSNSVIFVDDESGYVSVKNTASRKVIGIIPKDVYDGGL